MNNDSKPSELLPSCDGLLTIPSIIRLNVIPPLYAIFALVCATVGETAEYIVPIPKVFESVALCCLFLLMLEFAVPNSLVDPGMTFTILRNECVAKKQGKSWYTV